MSKRTTPRNDANQTTASAWECRQAWNRSLTCINIPFSATTTMEARTHCGKDFVTRMSTHKDTMNHIIGLTATLTFGSGWNSGPTKSKTNRRIRHEKKLANCVLPPTFSWIILREREAAVGTHPNKDPNKLAHPC